MPQLLDLGSNPLKLQLHMLLLLSRALNIHIVLIER